MTAYYFRCRDDLHVAKYYVEDSGYYNVYPSEQYFEWTTDFLLDDGNGMISNLVIIQNEKTYEKLMNLLNVITKKAGE